MALQIQFADQFGAVHPAAYVRINKIVVDNPVGGPVTIDIDVCVYVNESSKVKVPVWGPQVFSGSPVNPAGITLADIYTWLKTQPPFVGAIDV